MYGNYYYPFYRRYPNWGRGWGYPYGGRYNNYYGGNIFGSAIAYQNQNIVGGTGIVANQYANPIAIW